MKIHDDMYNTVLGLELLGLDAKNYVIYHNVDSISDSCRMVNVIDCGRYNVDVKRNKLLLKESFVVIHKDTKVKTICSCCGQHTVTNG